MAHNQPSCQRRLESNVIAEQPGSKSRQQMEFIMGLITKGNKIDGFTLVELMIAVAITSLVSAALVWSYTKQQESYIRQELVTDLQQNIRAGVYLISQELRMAGYDPTGGAGAGITAATETSISFSQDLNNNGSLATLPVGANPNENIVLSYNNLPSGNLTRRSNGGAAQILLGNVDFVEFLYTLKNGTRLTDPTPSQFSKIQSIRISVLLNSGVIEPNFVNNFLYETGTGATRTTMVDYRGANFDNLRRRALFTTVQCGNI